MSKQTIQGRFNAQKEKFIELLKEKGVFLKHCSERGFLYELIGPIFGKNHRFTIALKNGVISVINMDLV